MSIPTRYPAASVSNRVTNMEVLISDIMIISLHDSQQLALINRVYVLLYSINVRKNPFQLKSKSTPKKCEDITPR